MKSRSHSIVARMLIIGPSRAKSCRLHLTSCNDTVAQQLSHSCRAHPERLRVVWRVLDIHTHSYTPKYASAGADSTGISRHKQQHASFCKLRQCNTGMQCAAACRRWRSHCGGWPRRGEARRLQWHKRRQYRPIKERVEDRRGRDQRCSSGAVCVLMLHGARLPSNKTHTMPPCNPRYPPLYNPYTLQ